MQELKPKHCKNLECFIARLLETVPYQHLLDAAIQAAFDTQCSAPDELRDAIAKVSRWIIEKEPLPLPDGYVFCQKWSEE